MRKIFVLIIIPFLFLLSCSKKEPGINKIEDIKIEEQIQLECLLPNGSYTSLFQNVYGLRIIFRHDDQKRLIAMNGLFKLNAKDFAKFRPTDKQTINPGPAVTAMPSKSVKFFTEEISF